MSWQLDDKEENVEIKCWWKFFHKWSIWVDTEGGAFQRRRCDKCGKSQERYV